MCPPVPATITSAVRRPIRGMVASRAIRRGEQRGRPDSRCPIQRSWRSGDRRRPGVAGSHLHIGGAPRTRPVRKPRRSAMAAGRKPGAGSGLELDQPGYGSPRHHEPSCSQAALRRSDDRSRCLRRKYRPQAVRLGCRSTASPTREGTRPRVARSHASTPSWQPGRGTAIFAIE
jgi:hypothetical protein